MLATDTFSPPKKPLPEDSTLPHDVVKRQRNKRQVQRNSSSGTLIFVIGSLAVLIGGFMLKGGGVSLAAPDIPASPLVGLRRVVGLGRLEPEGGVISVAVPTGAVASRVEKLLFGEGDAVDEGDVLAVLDNQTRLEASRQVAIQTVKQAQAKLAQTLLEVSTTTKRLQAHHRTAKARLSLAKSKLARCKTLLDTQATSQEAFDECQINLISASEAVEESKSRLERYAVGADGERVDVTVARRDLEVAKASLRQAEANLEQSIVRAPFEGTILRIDGRVGERVGQSSLLEMGATKHMMACVEVYESDVPRVQVGQQATLSGTPLSQSLTGQVDRISHLVQKQGIVDAAPAASTDARVVEVWVRLDPESSKQAAKFVNLQVRVELQP